MGTYRKVPVNVEAFQFTGSMTEPGWPAGWLDEDYRFEHGGRTLVINLRDGKVRVKAGDWVVRDSNPTADKPYYGVNQHYFDALYEEVEQEAVQAED